MAMKYTAMILKPNERIPEEVAKKMCREGCNIPVFDQQSGFVNAPVIGTCNKLFWKDGKLYAEIEIFDQDISIGFMTDEDDVVPVEIWIEDGDDTEDVDCVGRKNS